MIKYKRITVNIQSRLDNLPNIFAKYPQVDFAILFGSYAAGNPGPLSDVDIAYMLSDVEPKVAFEIDCKLFVEITQCLGTDEISFICLNEAPVTVRFGVIANGKVIYLRNENKLLDFKVNTMKHYIDTKEIREEYYKELFDAIRRRHRARRSG